jgi:hypothetical protein
VRHPAAIRAGPQQPEGAGGRVGQDRLVVVVEHHDTDPWRLQALTGQLVWPVGSGPAAGASPLVAARPAA